MKSASFSTNEICLGDYSAGETGGTVWVTRRRTQTMEVLVETNRFL